MCGVEERQIGLVQRELQLARNRAEERAHLVGGLRREQRDVDVEAPLPLEIDLEQIGTRRREHPEDAAAVARVAHLLGEHRVDAARQAAVAIAALALARRLIGLVDEHHHLADRLQHREDLLEVRLGGADPAIAEVLEDDARHAELARPALHEEGLAGADSPGNQIPHRQRVQRALAQQRRIVAQPGLDRVAAGEVIERERSTR